MLGAVGGAAVPRRNAFQLSGLKMFLSDTQGRIVAHAPWPIQPWAGGRNPFRIVQHGDRRRLRLKLVPGIAFIPLELVFFQ